MYPLQETSGTICDSIGPSPWGEASIRYPDPAIGIPSPLSHRSPASPMRQILRFLFLLPLLVAACTSYSVQSTTASIKTGYDATDEELRALLDRTGWRITEFHLGFHEDPRGFTGDLYELERQDGRGFVALYVFHPFLENGSVFVDAAEDIAGEAIWELIEGLRDLYQAIPTWRDAGVVFCLDHDPRHALECQGTEDVERMQGELRERYGCQKMSWNPPVKTK